MSQLSDRLAQAATAINQLMATLVADVGKIEEGVNAAADSRAQQAIANALANSQDLITSVKNAAKDQLALAQKDFDNRLAAAEADFKAKLAVAKVKA